MRVWRSFVVMLASCYQPQADGSCTILCGQDGACPEGYSCSNERCRAPGAADCDSFTPADAALDTATTSDAPPDVAIDSACPPSYTIVFGNNPSRYRYEVTARPWLAAQQACIDDRLSGATMHHTHLAVVESELERSQLGSFQMGFIEWIGYTELALDDTFLHVTNQNPMYPTIPGTMWNANNAPSGNGACVTLLDNANLEDDACSTARRYFCECDAFAVVPANYGQ